MRKAIVILAAGMILSVGGEAIASDATSGRGTPDNSSRFSSVDRDVREAFAAELAGDNARRDEFLAAALESDPSCLAARWQAGYVKLDGKWLTPLEIERKYAADHTLGEYRRQRDQAAAAGLFARGNVYASAGTAAGNTKQARSTAVEDYSSAGLSPAGLKAHADLAQWCRAKRLTDEERAHWTQVLIDEPGNSEAQSRLGMRLYMGSLMTNSQIDAVKKQHAAEDKQLADWKPTVARWRKSLDGAGDAEAAQAVAEMQEIKDAAIIPALEWAVYSDSPTGASLRSSPGHPSSDKHDAASKFQRQAIALLGRLPEQRATYSLAGHAVLAPQAELRRLAADELKKRALHDFVPILLAGLANPIRFDYVMRYDRGDGSAVYRAVASQEGPDAIRQVEYSSKATGLVSSANGGRKSGDAQFSFTDAAPTSRGASQAARYDNAWQNRLPGPRNWTEVPGAIALARQSQLLAASIDSRNARIAQTNQRIKFVLERVVQRSPEVSADSADESDAIPDAALAESAASTANYWWNWWADFNESSAPDKAVSITAYSDSSSINQDQYIKRYTAVAGVTPTSTTPGRPTGMSYECFAAGNPVTTLTGPVPIEKVQIGDRVLAQDADTGELAYKPVLGTTVRPPADMVLVATSGGTVRATRGHPFWIVGQGWRMAKELQVGDKIHGLHGSLTVTAVSSQPAERAYNLIVADFGTYFVGDGQLLAHDNTPRLPTAAAVPGFIAASR